MVELVCDPIEEVLEDLKNGKLIILVDDEGRENEGDLVGLGDRISEEQIAFMMQFGRGLICTTIDATAAERLSLPLQATLNNSSFDTPFSVSVDHVSVAMPSGVEARSRLKTIRALADSSTHSTDLVTPGFVYPLIAHPLGVFGRRGQTEGSYDLARIVNASPSGVICEILNDDGTMMRGGDLMIFARRFGLKISSIEEIHRYRTESEHLYRETGSAERTIDGALFNVRVFEDDRDGKEHLLLWHDVRSDTAAEKSLPLIRIHSECLTGDVFGSRRCDCGPQLDEALEQIIGRGYGGILYLRQEGRGIGLGNKIRAYALQDKGFDTVDANLELGFDVDSRQYRMAALILNALQIKEFDLLTNNPLKLESMKKFGFSNVNRVATKIFSDCFNEEYLAAKRHKLGHIL